MLVYNPYVLPVILSALLACGLAIAVWQQRHGQPGVGPFVLMMLALAVWAGAYGIELAVPDLDRKLPLVTAEFIGIAATPVMTLLFALSYTGRSHWILPRNIVLLLLIPATTVALMAVNGTSGLVYTQIALDMSGGFAAFDGMWGPWFWVHSTYSYVLMLLSFLLIAGVLSHSSRLYRRQTIIILIGMTAPWITNVIHLAGFSPWPFLDLTPFAFSITGLAAGWGLLRLQLTRIVPAARDTVLENMSDGVIVLDEQNLIVDLNPAARRIFGELEHGVIGKTITEVLANNPSLRQNFRDLQDTNVEIELERDGRTRYYDLRLSVMHDRRKNVTGKVVVLREITRRKEVERALSEARDQAVEADAFKTRMVTAVSHDFRTPLGVIIGHADMLQAGRYGKLNENQLDSLERIINNATRLSKLVNDLLDEAAISQGRLTLNITQFEPQRLLEPLENLITDRAKQKGLEVKFTVEEGVPDKVRGDLSRLIQVLTNLTENALKFTDEGSIEVRIFKPDTEHWGIEVKDTGVGIENEDQAHVFDAFWQATREAGVAKPRGSGLGLSIVKNLVDRMNGKIVVYSSPGKGTSFIITLPIKSVKEMVREQAAGIHS